METTDTLVLMNDEQPKRLLGSQEKEFFFMALLDDDVVDQGKLNTLCKADRKEFMEWVHVRINISEDNEAARIRDKVEHLLPMNETRKDEIWERNHTRITDYIKERAHTTKTIPTKTEIAMELGLSRKTVTKHLTEYRDNRKYKERKEAEEFMLDTVKDRVLAAAVDGDLKAARLCLDFTKLERETVKKGTGDTYINNQHNYLQLNGITLTQELIASLSPVQLSKIEEVLKGE